ncbi:hypothetical protein ACFX13_046884 [Malus domestica]
MLCVKFIAMHFLRREILAPKLVEKALIGFRIHTTSDANPKLLELSGPTTRNKSYLPFLRGNLCPLPVPRGPEKRCWLSTLSLKRCHTPSKVFVTAPTGAAACAIRGQTLHSFAGIGCGNADRIALLSRVLVNKEACKRWLKAEALVIDEVSMVDVEACTYRVSIPARLRCTLRFASEHDKEVEDNVSQKEYRSNDNGGRETKMRSCGKELLSQVVKSFYLERQATLCSDSPSPVAFI